MTEEHEAWAERAENALGEAGYRRGGARRAMVDLLDGHSCGSSSTARAPTAKPEMTTAGSGR